MNELQIFKNYLFGEVRTVLIENEVWFVLIDVCRALNLTNSRMVASRLDDDEVSKFDLRGQSGETHIVNESGLYSVILRSDKPEAKSFKKWVTSEILPSIRKHGMYATEELLANPDLFIQVLTELKKEKEVKRLLENKAKEDKPKVIFADAVSTSRTSILVGELAKLLKQNGVEIGQNRLFEWLRANGYLISKKSISFNMPTQKAMNLELFEIKETSITHADGHITVSKTPKVTGKGQLYFINKFLVG